MVFLVSLNFGLEQQVDHFRPDSLARHHERGVSFLRRSVEKVRETGSMRGFTVLGPDS